MTRRVALTVIGWAIITEAAVRNLLNTSVSVRRNYLLQVLREQTTGDLIVMAAAVFLFAAVPCAIGTMCGVAILRGLNWGRLLYLCFIPLVLWLSAQMGAVFQIPSVVLYVISLFVLLREGSSFRKNSG